MPLIIALEDIANVSDAFRFFFFLLKEDELPLEFYTVARQRITNAQKFHNAGKEKILEIAEETIEEFGGTLIPYSLCVLRY